jgi:hypothetical protein
MPANTGRGYPYPLATDPRRDGATAIQLLAEATDRLDGRLADEVTARGRGDTDEAAARQAGDNALSGRLSTVEAASSKRHHRTVSVTPSASTGAVAYAHGLGATPHVTVSLRASGAFVSDPVTVWVGAVDAGNVTLVFAKTKGGAWGGQAITVDLVLTVD